MSYRTPTEPRDDIIVPIAKSYDWLLHVLEWHMRQSKGEWQTGSLASGSSTGTPWKIVAR